MKTCETAGLVVKHQWSGLGLPGLVANFQKCVMFARISRSRLTQRLRPLIGDGHEMRIGAAPEIRDQLGQRVRKIFVIADAEAIALHDDVAAKMACLVVYSHERIAFCRPENPTC